MTCEFSTHINGKNEGPHTIEMAAALELPYSGPHGQVRRLLGMGENSIDIKHIDS